MLSRARLLGRLPAVRHAAPLVRAVATTAQAADKQPIHVSEISGERLYLLAKLEGPSQQNAARERLRREIMRVDDVDYAGATPKLLEINAVNSSGLVMKKLPYQLTMYSSIFAGWVSLPLVFSLPLAKLFNQYAVTTDVPEINELDTMMEVGMWTWNWMEPPLGTVSFFLLCMQFAREASSNLGNDTPAMRHKKSLAKSLAAAFPMYNKECVSDYAMAAAFEDDADDITSDSEYVTSLK